MMMKRVVNCLFTTTVFIKYRKDKLEAQWAEPVLLTCHFVFRNFVQNL